MEPSEAKRKRFYGLSEEEIQNLIEGKDYENTRKATKPRSTLIRIFWNPDKATIHTYPANWTANPEKNKSALRDGKNISAANPITCGRANPDIFESNDVKSVSSLHDGDESDTKQKV